MNEHCLGIDLGAVRIRAVAIDDRGVLGRALTLPRERPCEPYGASEIDRLVDALRRRGFGAERVEAVLPRSVLRSSVVELPAADTGAPLERIARAQIAHERGEDPDSFELAIWHSAGSAGASCPGIVVTGAHELTEPIALGFESAGVDLLAMRAPESALAAVVQAAEGPEPHIVLDLGWTSATISLVESGVVRFARSLTDLGFGRLVERFADKLGIDRLAAGELLDRTRRTDPAIAAQCVELLRPHGQRLAEEIANSVAYIQRILPDRKRIRITACGGGADDSDLTDFLTIEVGWVVAPVWLETGTGTLSPAHSAAAGAAIIGAADAGGER